jgi:hypothetical protein
MFIVCPRLTIDDSGMIAEATETSIAEATAVPDDSTHQAIASTTLTATTRPMVERAGTSLEDSEVVPIDSGMTFADSKTTIEDPRTSLEPTNKMLEDPQTPEKS